MIDLSTMPPAIGGAPGAESEEQKRYRLAHTMPPAVSAQPKPAPDRTAMPPIPSSAAPMRPNASVTPLEGRAKELALGATAQPTMPPVRTMAQPPAPEIDRSVMPPIAGAGPNVTLGQPAKPASFGDATPDRSAMPPIKPSFAQRYEEQAGAEPQRKDFPKVEMPFWKKALGMISAGAGGFGRHDNTTFDLARGVIGAPEAKAEKKFGQAHDIWQRGLEAIQKESGLKNTESEIRHRDTETEQLQDKPEHQDIVKEFSDALAKGDQARIEALAPRVKQFMETSQKPPKEAAEKSTKEQLQQQIAAADAKGDKATVKTLQARLKAIDPLGGERLHLSIENAAEHKKEHEETATRQQVRDHDKAYVQPAEGVEKSYQMMDSAFKEYQAAKAAGKELPTGAQSMLALSTHLSTTFGNVKGSRVTKDMIEHHLGARSVSDSALVAFQKLTNGDVLSPEQWKAFHDLIGESRKLSWDTAVKEAKRKSIPVDFLPDDLKGGSAAAGGALPPGWK